MITATDSAQDHQVEYDEFIQRINARFSSLTGPVFRTDAAGLYERYLAGFDEGDERQYHTCSCCKQFIERFGNLAIVDDSGRIVPAMWEGVDVPKRYQAAIAGMAAIVRRAKLTIPFLSSEKQYGTPTTGLWTHFAVKPDVKRVHTGYVTAFATASLKREELGSVALALTEYSKDTVDLALKLLNDDHLANSAAVLGEAQFLVDLHAITAPGDLRDNLVYRAVAAAPSGFCHPRQSMIATLLDDIAAGKSFEQAKAAWARKMHPLAYQRPVATPSAGNIAQAEKLFTEMGLASALQRRIARFDEVPKLWEPLSSDVIAKADAIFAHLAPKTSAAPSMVAPAILITLDKFVRTVVPAAEAMEVQLASGYIPIIIITAPVDADAAKLFQWDHPFGWYVWHGGVPASQYGLVPGWAKLTGITRLPARWGDETEKFAHQGDGLVLMIEGARETRVAGAALFPSTLRSELREVRSVIEAHSNSAKMQGLAEGTAIGIDLRAGSASFNAVQVRVTSAGASQVYKIDRWD